MIFRPTELLVVDGTRCGSGYHNGYSSQTSMRSCKGLGRVTLVSAGDRWKPVGLGAEDLTRALARIRCRNSNWRCRHPETLSPKCAGRRVSGAISPQRRPETREISRKNGPNCKTRALSFGYCTGKAEGGGFEPPRSRSLYRISSPARSTALPPLRVSDGRTIVSRRPAPVNPGAIRRPRCGTRPTRTRQSPGHRRLPPGP